MLDEKLYKGYIKAKKECRREYAITEIKKYNREDLLEIKYQFEASLNTTISWPWVIALYGAVLALLSSDVLENLDTSLRPFLFTVVIVGAGGIAVGLHRMMAVQRYLLCRVEERLRELGAEENKEYGIRERIAERMVEDGVLSERKIAEYSEMTVEQIRKIFKLENRQDCRSCH